MAEFIWTVRGKLTKKQKQALNTMETITRAFYDEQYNNRRRTWRELKQMTGLSNGALSKHLKELIDQHVVRRVPAVTYYEYTGESVCIKGKKRQKMQEVTRFYKSRQNPKDIRYQEGYLTKPRARSVKDLARPPKRFVRTGPLRRFPPKKAAKPPKKSTHHR